VAVLRAGDLAESDTFWQIRTGLFILEHGYIPMVDPFSWTARGEAWRMNSWGFNVVVALAYRVAGLPGVAILCGAAVMGIFALTLLLARRLGAPPFATGALLLAGSPLLIEWISARPQLVDYASVLVLVLLLRRPARDRPSLTRLAGVAALAVVWVNLHAGVLLGVAIVVAAAVLVVLCRRTRASTPWFLVASGVMALFSLVNPYGIGLIDQTASVRSAAVGLTEWQPLNLLDLVHSIPFALGVLALIVVARRRDLVLSASLTVTLAGSVVAIRFVPIVFLLAVPALATLADRPAAQGYLESRRVLVRRMGVLAVAAYSVVAATNLVHLGQPDPGRFSIPVVLSIPPGCRLFNSYDLGGLVLLERPDMPVSIDSRAELYGAGRIQRYARIESGRDDPGSALAKVQCVLMPSRSGLAKQLAFDPGWRLARSDRVAVLFVRA
jgi:hypothetical protein